MHYQGAVRIHIDDDEGDVDMPRGITNGALGLFIVRLLQKARQ